MIPRHGGDSHEGCWHLHFDVLQSCTFMHQLQFVCSTSVATCKDDVLMHAYYQVAPSQLLAHELISFSEAFGM